jgi:hypothetical protein
MTMPSYGNPNRDFQAEQDGNDLINAENIKQDHGRFKKAMKHVASKAKQHKSAHKSLDAQFKAYKSAQASKDNGEGSAAMGQNQTAGGM